MCGNSYYSIGGDFSLKRDDGGIKMNNKNKRKGIYIINKDGKTEKVILPL